MTIGRTATESESHVPQGGYELNRFSKSALALSAVLAVVAVGCGGGATSSPITDSSTLITQSALSLSGATTLHLEATMSGSLNAGALGSGTGLSGSIKLDGATMSGDLDVRSQAVHLNVSVPTLFGLAVDMIQVDGYQYVKLSTSGDKYTKSNASSLPIGTPAPSASLDMTKTVAQLKDALTTSGVTATIKGTEKVDGRDAYRVALEMPISKINDLIAAQGGSSVAGMTLDSASLDYWVYKDTTQPAKVELKGASSQLGNIDLVLTLTKYGDAVKIVAPSADQIQAS